MMQRGNAFQGHKCARCRQAIQNEPAFDDDLWYHRACLEEGTRALQRAEELAARFGGVPVAPLRPIPCPPPEDAQSTESG